MGSRYIKDFEYLRDTPGARERVRERANKPRGDFSWTEPKSRRPGVSGVVNRPPAIDLPKAAYREIPKTFGGTSGVAPTGNLPVPYQALGSLVGVALGTTPQGRALSIAWRVGWAIGKLLRGTAYAQNLRSMLYGLYQRPKEFEGYDMTGWTLSSTFNCHQEMLISQCADPNACPSSRSSLVTTTFEARVGQLLAAGSPLGSQYFASFYRAPLANDPLIGRTSFQPGGRWRSPNYGVVRPIPDVVEEISVYKPGVRFVYGFAPAVVYDRSNWLASVFPQVLPISQAFPQLAPQPRGFDKLKPFPFLPPYEQNRYGYYVHTLGQDPYENPVKPFAPDEVPYVHPPVQTHSGGRGYIPPRLGGVHEMRSPPRFSKEKKVSSSFLTKGINFFNSATEVGDFVDVLYDALPYDRKAKYGSTRHLLRSVPWKLKLQLIYDNFEFIDVSQAVEGFIENEIEDRLYGKLGKFRGKVANRLGKTSSQLTNLEGTAYDRSRRYWDNVIKQRKERF